MFSSASLWFLSCPFFIFLVVWAKVEFQQELQGQAMGIVDRYNLYS